MKTSKFLAAFSALAFAAAFTANVQAQTPISKDSMPGMNISDTTTDKPATAATTDGEVRKIDKENQKITLRHGDIKNLDMPGMTMVFKVKDPAMLDKIQVGSKVKFKAKKEGGAFEVTTLEVTP